MLVNLMLSQSLISFATIFADVAIVGSLHMLGFNVTSTISLVPKVLDAGHARPDSVDFHHMLHQGKGVT